MFEVPQFTFSFYMLIIIHACSTMYFATFNGKYLRYDMRQRKKRRLRRKPKGKKYLPKFSKMVLMVL